MAAPRSDPRRSREAAQPPLDAPVIAFVGSKRVARGSLRDVTLELRRRALAHADEHPSFLVFDAVTSARVDLDLRGSEAEVLARLEGPTPPASTGSRRGPGRPRLGVVAREVTLLPRHWAWLSEQPGGASATLRKLIETARRDGLGATRQVQDRAYRFMTAMAGDEPGYEDAIRALYRGDGEAFERSTSGWPVDVRDHSRELAQAALSPSPR